MKKLHKIVLSLLMVLTLVGTTVYASRDLTTEVKEFTQKRAMSFRNGASKALNSQKLENRNRTNSNEKTREYGRKMDESRSRMQDGLRERRLGRAELREDCPRFNSDLDTSERKEIRREERQELNRQFREKSVESRNSENTNNEKRRNKNNISNDNRLGRDQKRQDRRNNRDNSCIR